MEWSVDLSVKVTTIDDQHKKLIEMINNLHDAMRTGKGKQVLEKTLQDLAAYAVYHFQAEEMFMQRFQYVGYLTHKMKHDAFVKKITDFQKDYAENKLGLTIELMNFLRDWVANHIKETDKQYSETFRKEGLS
jgi:hemerythrin